MRFLWFNTFILQLDYKKKHLISILSLGVECAEATLLIAVTTVSQWLIESTRIPKKFLNYFCNVSIIILVKFMASVK